MINGNLSCSRWRPPIRDIIAAFTKLHSFLLYHRERAVGRRSFHQVETGVMLYNRSRF